MTETSDLSQKLNQLEKAKPLPQNSIPKIQRVVHYLRDRKHFAKHYSPRLMSIGPIHNGAKNLQLGEKYKLMWAKRYLERTHQDAKSLYRKIASKIKELKVLFAEDVIGNSLDDEKLSWMLLVDGCSLLQILEKGGNFVYPEEMNVKVDQLVLVWQDVLLLENQIPYQVLQLLSGSGHQNDAELLERMNEFLRCYHLLDQLRRTVLRDPPKKHHDHENNTTQNKKKKSKKNKNKDCNMITYRNIQALKAAGILLKKSNTSFLTDISFSSGLYFGELSLPEITVDDTTASTFLNLIAYEMCPDFKNNYEICSFVAFMDSLIDYPDDVTLLRSYGVLRNMLGSDDEVAKLFNVIGADLVPNMESYSHVRCGIEKHYRNKCKTWIALAFHVYFGYPTAFYAFSAAVVGLVLTFIQTWFAIHPRHSG